MLNPCSDVCFRAQIGAEITAVNLQVVLPRWARFVPESLRWDDPITHWHYCADAWFARVRPPLPAKVV